MSFTKELITKAMVEVALEAEGVGFDEELYENVNDGNIEGVTKRIAGTFSASQRIDLVDTCALSDDDDMLNLLLMSDHAALVTRVIALFMPVIAMHYHDLRCEHFNQR